MNENNGEMQGIKHVSPEDQRGKAILLLDDDGTSLQRMQVLLERRGYRVIAEQDSRNALALMQNGTHPIDLVITDYRMPNMDGLEFSRALKRSSPETPLILITAHSDIESYLKAADIGVREYINKPIIANELLRIVSIMLERRNDGSIG